MYQFKRLKKHGQKAWIFFWKDDSVWSWIANIIVAFLLIRFIVYPLLGILLGTGYPIVAVLSESMEHGLHDNFLCGIKIEQFPHSFDNYWNTCGGWYQNYNITSQQFSKFPFSNGFNKGDVIILWHADQENLHLGDVLVFKGSAPQPIIHRIVKIWNEDNNYYYQTKGDHNSNSINGLLGETNINEERILGKGILRIPYLGWIKIIFVDAVKPLGINIQR